MKRSSRSFLYEVVAAALLAVGALLLVRVYLPLINPGLYAFVLDELGRPHRIPHELRESAQPFAQYVIGTPLALLALAAAWWFNVKACKSREEI